MEYLIAALSIAVLIAVFSFGVLCDLSLDEIERLERELLELRKYAQKALECMQAIRDFDEGDGKPWHNSVYLHTIDYLEAQLKSSHSTGGEISPGANLDSGPKLK